MRGICEYQLLAEVQIKTTIKQQQLMLHAVEVHMQFHTSNVVT